MLKILKYQTEIYYFKYKKMHNYLEIISYLHKYHKFKDRKYNQLGRLHNN